jgi:type III secretion system FlhB-like substrate exporter
VAPSRRISRRRKLARTVRSLTGGRQPLPVALETSDDIGTRLVELASETRLPLRDSDQAELLARLRMDDRIPPDVLAAICATLLPILEHTAPGADA